MAAGPRHARELAGPTLHRTHKTGGVGPALANQAHDCTPSCETELDGGQTLIRRACLGRSARPRTEALVVSNWRTVCRTHFIEDCIYEEPIAPLWWTTAGADDRDGRPHHSIHLQVHHSAACVLSGRTRQTEC